MHRPIVWCENSVNDRLPSSSIYAIFFTSARRSHGRISPGAPSNNFMIGPPWSRSIILNRWLPCFRLLVLHFRIPLLALLTLQHQPLNIFCYRTIPLARYGRSWSFQICLRNAV